MANHLTVLKLFLFICLVSIKLEYWTFLVSKPNLLEANMTHKILIQIQNVFDYISENLDFSRYSIVSILYSI